MSVAMTFSAMVAMSRMTAVRRLAAKPEPIANVYHATHIINTSPIA